jgi:glycosyltransferase involved in cell wall biosynthesis
MGTASQPLVSIVTPVYNNAEYLAECVESVLAQTYENWDYTIVDNASTDGSVEIAHRYATKDARIRVRTNPQFLEIIANHNVTLRQISPVSKYAKMVFADDWIFRECLERMIEVAEVHASVGIVGAYGLEGTEVVWTGLPYPSGLVSGREVCRQRFLDRLFVFGSGTALLFRADLVRARDPFYNESNLHADMEACVDLLKTCDFGFVNQVLCYSRVRPDSNNARASEITSYKAGFLQELITHGLDFLTVEEFNCCLHGALSDYYNFLGVNLLFNHNRRFWEYHENKLDEMGVGFSRARLVSATAVRLCTAVLNPMQTAEKLLRKCREVAGRGR